MYTFGAARYVTGVNQQIIVEDQTLQIADRRSGRHKQRERAEAAFQRRIKWSGGAHGTHVKRSSLAS